MNIKRKSVIFLGYIQLGTILCIVLLLTNTNHFLSLLK